MAFIEMKNISKTFFGIKALNNVELNLQYGEALCLAGQNGCGKSTLIKILSGVYQPDNNAIIKIGNKRFSKLTPEKSIEQGIQVIYQDLSLFPNLSVLENISINSYRKLGIVNKRRNREIAQSTIDSINADLNLDTIVDDLSIAQQQLVAICRALAQNAKLLIMDEPTASLTNKEVEDLLNLVIKLKSKGISIIFVSHKLNEVMKVSDNILILKDGCILGKYPAKEMNEKKIAKLMTGLDIQLKKLDSIDMNNASTIMEIKNLYLKNQYKGISLSIKKGEVISIVGLLGSGRTELCLSLFGINKPDSGEIIIDNKTVSFKNNQDAIKEGIGYVSEDRMSTGLIMSESIHNNIISAILKKISNKVGIINNYLSYKTSNTLISSLNIKTSNSNHLVSTLSGGNAQRVSIAKWLAINPKIIILDSPTIGVDIANKDSIFQIIRALSRDGVSVIFVTDEIEEAYYNSHRVIVMKKGEIIKEIIPELSTEEDIKEVVYESRSQ